MSHSIQMSPSLYSRLHSAVGFGEAAPAAAPALDWPWREGLPVQWQDAVVVPLGFRRHRDYKAAARRVLGLDENGEPCYCHHQYRVNALRSDDDEDFYEETLYLESGTSWRLRDGRWLNYRRVGGRGFFSFSEEMPR